MDLATGQVHYGEGEFTLVTANGDTIRGTYTGGHGNIASGVFTDEWTFLGGTGRFAGVTGHGTDYFVVLNPTGPASRPFVDTIEGWVSYDASNRRH